MADGTQWEREVSHSLGRIEQHLETTNGNIKTLFELHRAVRATQQEQDTEIHALQERAEMRDHEYCPMLEKVKTQIASDVIAKEFPWRTLALTFLGACILLVVALALGHGPEALRALGLGK